MGVYPVASMATDPAGGAQDSSATYLANLQTGGTLVSTNKGASWTGVRTSSNQPLVIVLDAISAQYGWSTPASVPTAPGLVVANAFPVGGSSPTVYISRDGGLGWTEATQPSSATGATTPQPYYFEILDHGSAIVLVETSAGTSSVFYSLDEGGTWNSYNFLDATTILGTWTLEQTCGIPRNQSIRFSCEPLWAGVSGEPGRIQCEQQSGGMEFFEVEIQNSANGFLGSRDGIVNRAYITSSTYMVSGCARSA